MLSGAHDRNNHFAGRCKNYGLLCKGGSHYETGCLRDDEMPMQMRTAEKETGPGQGAMSGFRESCM
jgi:hypothetical protein